MFQGASFTRGGQTALHSLRMRLQVWRFMLYICLAVTLFMAFLSLHEHTSRYDWYVARIYGQAWVLNELDRPWQVLTIRQSDGTKGQMTATGVLNSPGARNVLTHLWQVSKSGLFRGLFWALGMFGLLSGGFWLLGRRVNRKKHLRGGGMVSVRRLAAQVRRYNRWRLLFRPRPYRIQKIPYPAYSEYTHTLVTGSTGTGKTQVIADILEQIRRRGDRAIVYDKMGSFTKSFLDPAGDVLLNPLDKRSPNWSVFCEVRERQDFDQMAAALIPRHMDTADPFWVTAARLMFARIGEGIWRNAETPTNKELVSKLLKVKLSEAAELLKDTTAQSVIDVNNPKTTLSVRAMLSAHTASLDLLPDGRDRFSIRDWVENEARQGFLFLTSRSDQHEVLKGLISCWLEVAVTTLLSLSQSRSRKVWIILDELPSLHNIPSLKSGLAESRQFGGCFVLGVQAMSALRAIYGRNDAETVSGLCRTRLIMQTPDYDMANWASNLLGRSEIEEFREGLSYGSSEIRDGVSLTRQREIRPIVIPSEILNLPDLRGYLKFPQGMDIAKVKIRYRRRRAVAERLEKRVDFEGILERVRALKASYAEHLDGVFSAPLVQQSEEALSVPPFPDSSELEDSDLLSPGAEIEERPQDPMSITSLPMPSA